MLFISFAFLLCASVGLFLLFVLLLAGYGLG